MLHAGLRLPVGPLCCSKLAVLAVGTAVACQVAPGPGRGTRERPPAAHAAALAAVSALACVQTCCCGVLDLCCLRLCPVPRPWRRARRSAAVCCWLRSIVTLPLRRCSCASSTIGWRYASSGCCHHSGPKRRIVSDCMSCDAARAADQHTAARSWRTCATVDLP